MVSARLASGLTLAYREEGAGPALVQVHGLGTGHKNYDLLTPALSNRLHVYDVDLPGYGDSDAVNGGCTVYDFATYVAEFIEALGVAPVPVHGTSMGGCIAMVLAARHPELVERLVVTCSFARSDRAGELLRATWRTAGAAGARALAELTSVQGFSRGFWDRPEAGDTQAAFVEALESTTPEHFLRDLSVLDGIDLSDDVVKIRCETLLLGADEDIITPVQSAPSGLGMTDLQRLIPNAQLALLEDCGHFISIERPDDTAARIASFVLEGAT